MRDAKCTDTDGGSVRDFYFSLKVRCLGLLGIAAIDLGAAEFAATPKEERVRYRVRPGRQEVALAHGLPDDRVEVVPCNAKLDATKSYPGELP